MAERLTVNRLGQFGIEATPGTPVAAGKAFGLLVLTLGAKHDTKTFRRMGRKHTTSTGNNKSWTDGKLAGPGSYVELEYPFSGLWGAPTITTPGGGTNSRQSLWTPLLSGANSPKIYTLQDGDSVRAAQCAYGLTTGGTLKFTRDSVDADFALLGQTYTDNTSLTASPTVLDERAILGEDWIVYRDPTSAGIGTTKLTRVYEAEFGWLDAYTVDWPANQGSSTYVTHKDLPPKATLKLTLEADANGMTGLSDLRANTTEYFRIDAQGPIIEAAIPYELKIDCACRVVGDVPLVDKDGVWAVQYTLEIVEDTGWGNAAIISLVNKLATL